MIMRYIDDLGRVVIPKVIREQLGIKLGDQMVITVVDNGVMVTKYDIEVGDTQ